MNYVIIGNGTAGISAAEKIRKSDEKANITIVSDEKHLTYYRIKLSEALGREFSDKELFVKDQEWHDSNNINLSLNSKVEKIDIEKKQLEIKNSEDIKYDKLLIAVGSRSFIPPIKGNEKKGVFALRSLDDLKEIKDYFKNCEKITVLGGGLLGLEAAWAIKKLGKHVDVVEFFPHLLPRQLDEKISKKFSDILVEKELNLHLGVSAEEITGEKSVEGVKLNDGSNLETQAVLISAGVRPRLELIEGTNIEFDRGVKVDKYMKTNIDDIYAAGDIAEVDGVVAGLWAIAGDQGKVAGINMTGAKKEYELPKLTTMLNIAECSIFSTGDIEEYDDAYEEEVEEGDASYKLCVTDGKITGGIIFNDINKAAKIKKAISEKVDISEHLDNNLSVSEIIENI